jgi:hypothetical protein
MAAVIGTLIALVTAGRFVFAVCLIVCGIVIAGAVTVHRMSQTDWFRRRSDRLVRYVLYALGPIMLVAGGLILVFAQPSSPAACHKPAQVAGADTSASSFTITVSLSCATASGNQLWLMAQLLNEGGVGTAKHSEYYFAYSVKNDPGQQPFVDTPPNCVVRRYYLISVTSDQLSLLQSSQHTLVDAYYGEPIDTYISKYIISNVQTNHTCNK